LRDGHGAIMAARSDGIGPRAGSVATLEGSDLDRSNALSDGVFAIAITLLALGIDVPSSETNDLWEALGDTVPEIVSYVIAFGTVAVLWLGHHRLFGQLAQVDGRLMTLNLIYLGFVAFLPFPSRLLGDFDSQSASVVLFAVTVTCAVALALLMRLHARHVGLLERPPGRDPAAAQAAVVPAVFLASVPIAFVSPAAAQYAWLSIFPLSRWLARRTGG